MPFQFYEDQIEIRDAKAFKNIVKEKKCPRVVRFHVPKVISRQDIDSICDTLKHEDCPKELIFYANNGNHKDLVRMICKTLIAWNNLKSINLILNDNGFTDVDVKPLIALLTSEHCPQISLDLRNNNLKDRALRLFADCLSHPNFPRHSSLFLMNNYFSENAILYLIERLIHYPLKQDLTLYLFKDRTLAIAELFVESLKLRQIFPGSFLFSQISEFHVLWPLLLDSGEKNKAIQAAAMQCFAFAVCKPSIFPADILREIFAYFFPYGSDFQTPKGKAYRDIFVKNVSRYAFFTLPDLRKQKRVTESASKLTEVIEMRQRSL